MKIVFLHIEGIEGGNLKHNQLVGKSKETKWSNSPFPDESSRW